MRLISKSELCEILGLQSALSRRKYYDQLRKKYFTDEFLEKIGMSPDEYRKTRIFDAIKTKNICELLQIDQGMRV